MSLQPDQEQPTIRDMDILANTVARVALNLLGFVVGFGAVILLFWR